MSDDTEKGRYVISCVGGCADVTRTIAYSRDTGTPVDEPWIGERQLVKAVEAKDFAPATGIFSTRYMLMYLAEHGRNDLARKIVLHRGFPGWWHMLERGATTLWETWRESDDVYSNCHPMFGSVDEWILKYGKCDQ